MLETLFGYFNALKTHGIIKKSWWTEKVYSITDTSGKIFLKSTETMANVKVMKTKNGPKKLARQPFMNVSEGLIHTPPAQILTPNPGEENIKIEIEIPKELPLEIPEILNPGFSSPENVSMAKKRKFGDYVINE